MLTDPKIVASSGRGERRPVHTPTHINIQHKAKLNAPLGGLQHKPRISKLQPGERHTHHRYGRRGGQPASQLSNAAALLLSALPSTSPLPLLHLYCSG